MSVSGDKKDIFTTIGSYTSYSKNEGNIPKNKNTYPSVNNKKDVIPFLLDILKVCVGSEAVKITVGEILTKFLDKTEVSSKKFLKNQFIDSNSDKQISLDFKNNGYRTKASKIDYNKNFSIKENSESYYLYKNENIISFDNCMRDAIRLESTEINFNNILKVRYDKYTDEFVFISSRNNYMVNDFINDFIDNTTIINKKEIYSNVMNQLFGTISKNISKTVSDVSVDLELEKIISNLIEGDDNFEISQNDLDEIYGKAEDIVNGLSKHDLGCGVMNSSLNINDLSDLISEISGSTDSFAVSNALENLLENKTNLDIDIYNENKQTIKDNFFKKIIDSFVLVFIKSLTVAPQIRALLLITSSFKNNFEILDGKIIDSIKNYKSFIKCIIKEVINNISEFIYKKAIGLLNELIKPIIKIIAKEKIILYKRIIKNLSNPIPI